MKNELLFDLFNLYCVSFENKDEEIELIVKEKKRKTLWLVR
jgi:hypothetical protein